MRIERYFSIFNVRSQGDRISNIKIGKSLVTAATLLNQIITEQKRSISSRSKD